MAGMIAGYIHRTHHWDILLSGNTAMAAVALAGTAGISAVLWRKPPLQQWVARPRLYSP